MDGFDLLADGTRAGIVRELAVARRENPRDPAVPFSALRRRVGATDSGRFNYHLDKHSVPPAAFDDRTLRDATRVLDAAMRADLRHVRDDACPTCLGQVAWRFEGDLDPDAAVGHAYVVVCQNCGEQLVVTPGLLLFDHPAVVAAYRDAGVDLRDRLLWTLDWCLPGVSELVSEDPVRVAVDAGPDGKLRFAFGGDGNVVDGPGATVRGAHAGGRDE